MYQYYILQYLVKYIQCKWQGFSHLPLSHFSFVLESSTIHTHLFSTQRPAAAAASSILAFAVVKVQKRKALQKGFFFLAFIGWMSAALMAVLCRLKGRGKKGQKMGGVHVFSCNSVVVEEVQQQYIRITTAGGDELQNWEKRLLFCSSYSVLPFFVEASHTQVFTQKKGKFSGGKGDLIFL